MFCRQCGNRINENASFCPVCGAALQIEAQQSITSAPAPVTVGSGYNAKNKQRKNGATKILLIAVSVILILMGIGSMALSVVGSTTTAQVTGYEQVLFINNDDSTRNPSRYKLEYQFSVNGERYTGSVTRVFPGGSHMRQTIPVRYLPFWPHVNAEDGETAGLAGPVMTGLGALLLVITVKRKSRFRNKSR